MAKNFSQMIFENTGMKTKAKVSNAKMICNGQDCGALMFKGEGEIGHTSPYPDRQWEYNFQDFKKNAMIGNPEDFGSSESNEFLYAEMDGILGYDSSFGTLNTGGYIPPEGYEDGSYFKANCCIANAGVKEYYKETSRVIDGKTVKATTRMYCVFINGKLVYMKERAMPILITLPYGFALLAYENVMYNGLYTPFMYLDRIITYTKYGDTKSGWSRAINGEWTPNTEGNNYDIIFSYAANEYYSTTISLYDSAGFPVGSSVTFRSIAAGSTLPYRTIDINPSSSLYTPYNTKDYTYISLCPDMLGGRGSCASMITPGFIMASYTPGYVVDRGGNFREWYSGSLDWTDLYGNHYVPGYWERKKYYWRPSSSGGTLTPDSLRDIINWSSTNPLIQNSTFYSNDLISKMHNVFNTLYWGSPFVIAIYPGSTGNTTFSNWGVIYYVEDNHAYLRSYQDDFLLSEKADLGQTQWNYSSTRFRYLTLVDFTVSRNVIDISSLNRYEKITFYLIFQDTIRNGETYEYNGAILKKCVLDSGNHLNNISSSYIEYTDTTLGNYSFTYPGVGKSYTLGFNTTNILPDFYSLKRELVRGTSLGSSEVVYDYKNRLIYPYGGHYLFLPTAFAFSSSYDRYDLEPIIIDLDNIQGSLNYRNTG